MNVKNKKWALIFAVATVAALAVIPARADSNIALTEASPTGVAIAGSSTVSSPIPNLSGIPAVPGIDSLVTVLNMTGGNGPGMTTCLLGTITQLFGASATYLGQGASGAVKISAAGQTLSFYPIAATTDASLGNGIFLGGDQPLSVGTSCGTFTVIPAVANPTDLGIALKALGLNVRVNMYGVLAAGVVGQGYLVRPDYLVTHVAATGTPYLQFGSDGVLRFTDSVGNQQILHPAISAPVSLQFSLGTALNGVITVQTDGSGLLKLTNGSQLRLVPDMNMTLAPNGFKSPSLVNDRPNHYVYLIGVEYQGVTVTPFQ